jgi:hypothetical protein
MSLLCLFVRHTKGKEPLVDYSQSHVVTSFEYLDILKKKQWKRQLQRKLGKTNERRRKKSKPNE